MLVSPLTSRSRQLLSLGLALAVFASIALFLHGSEYSTSASSFRLDLFGGTHTRSSISTEAVEGYIEAWLRNRGNVNLTEYHETHGLKLDHAGYTSYLSHLNKVTETYLSHTDIVKKAIRQVHERTALRSFGLDLPSAPKQVITTDKTIDHLPVEFGRWKEIMPDWETRYFDDAALGDWVAEVFAGSRAEEIWRALPRRVLQTDVFRYMIMLVEGGIYTDSDTAPIIPAEQWGRPYKDSTPATLHHLTNILAMADKPAIPSDPEEIGREVYKASVIDHDEPSLVISIEADAIDFGWTDWRDRHMARAVQMTQWTFLDRPGHPVFLDALGRALAQAEEVRKHSEEAQEDGKEYTPPSALEWTGPGVFTDCVFTYLLARWGVRPDELVGQKEPFRIGDVLILPAGSFSSVSPFTEEEQRPWAATWHGFFGRWRGKDPAEIEADEVGKQER